MGSLRDPVVPLIHMGGPCSGTVLVGMSREQPQGCRQSSTCCCAGTCPCRAVSSAFVGSDWPLPAVKAVTAEEFAQRQREGDGFLEGLLLLGALPQPTLVHQHFQAAQ